MTKGTWRRIFCLALGHHNARVLNLLDPSSSHLKCLRCWQEIDL